MFKRFLKEKAITQSKLVKIYEAGGRRLAELTTDFNGWYHKTMLHHVEPDRPNKACAHVNKFMVSKWVQKLVVNKSL